MHCARQQRRTSIRVWLPRLGNFAGKPIELLSRALPEAASNAIGAAATKALEAALLVALRTMEKEPKAASRLLHEALAAASGAVDGGFGLARTPDRGRGPRGPGERPRLPAGVRSGDAGWG
jgi:hypothetical protein